MPTKYKIFTIFFPWTPANTRSQTVLPTIQNEMTPMHKPPPPFLMTVGGNELFKEFKIGGSMESLVAMVQIENPLRNYVNFTL